MCCSCQDRDTLKNFPLQGNNLLRRLPGELRTQIYDLVLAEGVTGAPDPIPGEERFTRTLKMPAITMVDYQTREETLGSFLQGKQFSVQLPRDFNTISRLESLQEDVLNRLRSWHDDSDKILEDMKRNAREVEEELHEYLENAPNLDLCPFSDVESLIVTYNGRVRVNIDDGISNWSPRSLLVGFRCCNDAGFEKWDNWKDQPDKSKQLNANGELDWTDFRGVRKAFVAALIKVEFYFQKTPYIDVLLHPMIQPVVKALCMFASGQKKPLRWVEVIAEQFMAIPQGSLGVEWAYLPYEQAIHESEPDDGFGFYPDERGWSDEGDSRSSRESSDGDRGEGEEDEDEDEGDGENSDDAENSEGQDDFGDDDNCDGDQASQTEAIVILEELQDNSPGSDEFEADKTSAEGDHNSEAQAEA